MSHGYAAPTDDALAGRDQARAMVVAHSELYREQLDGDAAATAEGCFPPLPELPEARVWKLLGVLASLYAELAVVSKDVFRIFRVRDRPFYESLRDCSAADLADMKTVVDYLLLPKPLLEAMETNSKVEACKQGYQAALSSYVSATSTEPRPTLIVYLKQECCLRLLAEAALLRLGSIQRTEYWFGEIFKADMHYGLLPHEQDWTARQAVLDGLMGEPISEYGYQPSPLRLQIYAAMCVVMERPIPWGTFSHVPPFADWLNPRIRHVLSPITAAAIFNRLPAFDDILAHGIDVSEPWNSVIDAAASCQNITVLEKMKVVAPHALDLSTEQSYECARKLLNKAASHGQQESLRWLLQNCDADGFARKTPGKARPLLGYAVAADDLNMAQRMCSAGIPMSDTATYFACRDGNKELLEWALGNGAAWSGDAFRGAAATGNLEFVLWALDRGCPVPPHDSWENASIPRAFLRAIMGDLAVLEMFAVRGFRLQPVAVTCLAIEAASMGRLDVLQWAKSQLSSRFTDVKNGAFDQVLAAALESGQQACVEWMMSFLGNAKPVDNDGRPRRLPSNAFHFHTCWAARATREVLGRLAPYYDLSGVHEIALYTGDLDLARWLLAHGFRPSEADVQEVLFSQADALPFLRFYVEEGGFDLRQGVKVAWSEVKTPACRYVACGGSVAMMEYVRSKGCEWDNSALSAAANHGQLPMLRWLRTQEPSWAWPEGLVKKAREWLAYETAAWAEEHGATS